MRFLKSFKYAIRGIIYCINNERNMRIHTVIAMYVFVFSFFFTLSRTQYALLFLTFSSVIAAEMFNSVAEELSDMAAAGFNQVVRRIKDMASGGVLVAAVFSVCVGICLFWRPKIFSKIVEYFAASPAMTAVLAVTIFLCVVYIILGPIGIRDFIRKKKNK